MEKNPVEAVGKSFPNLKARIASYDPATQVVILEQMTQARFQEVAKNPIAIGNEDDFSVILHELRHSIDHIGTLWGQENLLKLQKALTARLSGEASKFHNIIPYKREESQIFHSDYYSEEYQKTAFEGLDNRWRYSSSTGVRFNSEGFLDENAPILFAKFSTADDKDLMRVPLTVAALLETNSTHEETKSMFGAYAMQFPDEWQFHVKIYTDKLFGGLLYNQNLAVYSAAVHTAAQLLGVTQINVGFEISSAIATLALNMPHDLASNLPVAYEANSVHGKRMRALLNSNDRGTIFYILCHNYSDVYKGKKQYVLDDLLSANGLPKKEALLKIVESDFDRLHSEMLGGERFTARFSIYNRAGLSILQTGGLDGLNSSVWEKLMKANYKPPFAFIDGGIDVYNGALNRLNPSDQRVSDSSLWYNAVFELNRKMDDFYTVRGL